MNHEKILIVEDEENERSGLAELVTSWGYRVDTARDGAEGLEKATKWSPSIVVTDLKMPRMGGIELLERLAELTQGICVILVTAQGTIDSAVQAMRTGAYDYITKPIDTNRLRTILSNASTLLGARVEPSHPAPAARYRNARTPQRGLAQDAGNLSLSRDGCPQHRCGAHYRR
jgi:DNA-binding NtrC family response regulator